MTSKTNSSGLEKQCVYTVPECRVICLETEQVILSDSAGKPGEDPGIYDYGEF